MAAGLQVRKLFSALPVDPPGEFRLFARGVNHTEIGDFIFDDAAAAAVMANFHAEGVDQMVDLEHDSLDEKTRRVRADAADALAWYALEVRDGELWATGVKWCPEGERRLRARTQRYISPAFFTDEEGRIVEVINVALCARPATHGALPLVAARAKNTAGARPAAKAKRLRSMSPEIIKKALEVIASGDEKAALAMLQEIVAAGAGGESSEAETPPDPMAAGAGAPSDPPVPPEDPTKASAEVARLRAEVSKLTKDRENELVTLRATVQALQADKEAGEAVERSELVASLVRLGAEIPATAWADAAIRKPVARLASEPIAELRARVVALRAARPKVEELKADEAPLQLTEAQEAHCRRLNMNEAQRARYARSLQTARGRN